MSSFRKILMIIIKTLFIGFALSIMISFFIKTEYNIYISYIIALIYSTISINNSNFIERRNSNDFYEREFLQEDFYETFSLHE